MAFMSNYEREKQTRKINKGAGFRKVFILISLIGTILYVVAIILGVVGSCDHIIVGSKIITIDHTNGIWSIFTFKPADNKNDDISLFTSHGLVYFIFTCLLMVMDFISIWCIVLIKSPRTIATNAVRLSRSAIPGRRNQKSASSTVKERLGH